MAWLAFALTLAAHAGDEALHDFLSVYNPRARSIRARWPFLPVPVFTFGAWLALLAGAILALLLLSPLAFRGSRALSIAAVPVALLGGLANGAVHLLASVYYRRWMPGVYTAPLLLASGVVLLRAAQQCREQPAHAAAS